MRDHGRLVYVMGPSGAGKNSLIAGASEKLNKNKYLYFTHRYVTRPVNSDEDDFAISAAAFAHYCSNGLFALDWQAHGIRYGIGMYINGLLDSGATVVVNGSRAYLATARKKYPALVAVMVTAPPAVARARMLARGREDEAAIHARAMRTNGIAVPAGDVITIDNSGELQHATQALIDVLTGAYGVPHTDVAGSNAR